MIISKKEGDSRRGFFGEIIHYDAKGHKVGHSDVGFLGGINHYDELGYMINHTEPVFSEEYHYDSKGKRTENSFFELFRPISVARSYAP